MEKLTNADLLEDTVANSNNLKNKRLEKTSAVSGNPNPNPVPNTQVVNDNIVTEPKSEQSYVKEYIPSVERNSENENKNEDDNKIFGMNKFLFYGLVTTAVVIGGYFVYNKYFKKSGSSKSAIGSGSSGNAQSVSASNIAK